MIKTADILLSLLLVFDVNANDYIDDYTDDAIEQFLYNSSILDDKFFDYFDRFSVNLKNHYSVLVSMSFVLVILILVIGVSMFRLNEKFKQLKTYHKENSIIKTELEKL
jgi:hypothetical protein